MAAALRASSNTWFLKLEDQIGVRKTAKIAEAMGLKSLPLTGNRAITERDASLTLGSYETSVLQVAASFATIAAKGEYCTPTPFISGTNRGEPINIGKPECQQVISPTTAAHVSNMLTGVISSNDPGRTGKNAALKGGRVAMGKTGTTDGNAAVWFAGATPQYATAVWIGDPRGGFRYPVNKLYARGQWFNPVYGGGAPALIWKDIMDQIHQGLPKERFAKPGAVVDVNGNITMPDVSGLSVEAAKAILLNAGFTNVQVKTEPSSNQNLASNVVTGTLPKTGTVVPQDVETVTLIVTP